MDQFVCVRVIQANGMDLSLFQFDFDLTFAVFFLNADGTIYGRFGSRSALKEAEKDISIEGFGKALAAVLEMHRDYPANRSSLLSKKGPEPRYDVPEEYPSLKERFTSALDFDGQVARSCIHCHQVGEANRNVFRTAHEPIPDEVLFAWPMPDVLGLAFDPKEKATVAHVDEGSTAARDGWKAGDEILTLEGQPLVSIADVQWVLHRAEQPASLQAEILREGEKSNLRITLDEGWRRGSNLSWRPTSWSLRRMGTGGLSLENLPQADRREMGIENGRLALRVKHVGQYGAHAAAKRAGFERGDVIVAFDGRTDAMRETDLMAHAVQNRLPGELVPVTVLRNGEKVSLELPMQE